MKKVFSLILALMLVLSFALPATAAGKVKTTVTLSHTGTVTIAVGQTIQITATVTPDAPVAWSTKKAAVATVDGSGNVTGAAEGTTTIIAKAGGKSAKVKVKVVDPYKPTKIAINQGKAVTIGVGSPIQLGTALEPANAKATLAWKSSKPAIAAVDANGVVTPLAEGKAKVTVTTHNKKKATIAVTVVDPNKPAKVIIPQGKSAALTAGQTLQLSANLEPATAQAALTWTSSKPGVATVDANGLVTAVGKGKAKITVQAANYKKVKATFTVKVTAGAAASRDLSDYFGKTVSFAIGQLGKLGFHNDGLFDSDYRPFFRLSSSGSIMEASGSTPETAIIDSIDIFDSSEFNVGGVTYGMKWVDAKARLESNGWTLVGEDLEDWGTRYQKNNILIDISHGDTVSYVYAKIA